MSSRVSAMTLAGSPDAPLGETRLVRDGERLEVFVREWTDQRWTALRLVRPAAVVLQDGLPVLTLDLGGRQVQVGIPVFDAAQVRALVAAPAKPPARPHPKAADTEPELPAARLDRKAPKNPSAARDARQSALGSATNARWKALETQATRLLEEERYELAAATFKELGRAGLPEATAFRALADSTQRLARGDPEGAFFTLREEVDRTVTPSWVLSQAIAGSLHRKGRLVLAAAAFASAAAHAGMGDNTLAQRAAALRQEAGLDNMSLERAVVQATWEHYLGRLDEHAAHDEAGIRKTRAVLSRLEDAMTPLNAAARPAKQVIASAATQGQAALAQATQAVERAEKRGGVVGTAIKFAVWAIFLGVLLKACGIT